MKDDVAAVFDGAPLKATRRTGQEKFHTRGREHSFGVLDFWQWSVSDLVSNTWRGVVAEYIVAQALGAVEALRPEWRAYDLLTTNGVKVEVKSSAYIQSWQQNKLALIKFNMGKAYAWDADAGKLEEEKKRHADVYVFSVLTNKDRSTLDPLDLSQWEFYVVSTKALDDRHGGQKTISLEPVRRLSGAPVNFDGLRDKVVEIYRGG